MHAVVALLDEEHREKVMRLWEKVEVEFGVQPVSWPVPHFSLHVACDYRFMELQDLIERFARATGPIPVRTAGLGIFPGEKPVVYTPVVRHLALSVAHAALWPEVARIAGGCCAHYHPDCWMPHITLVHHRMRRETLRNVLHFLYRHSFEWTCMAERIAIVCDDGDEPQIRVSIPLTG